MDFQLQVFVKFRKEILIINSVATRRCKHGGSWGLDTRPRYLRLLCIDRLFQGHGYQLLKRNSPLQTKFFIIISLELELIISI